MRVAAWVAAPVILPRGVIVWGFVRLIVAALPLAVGAGFGSIPPSPIGIVLCCGVAGLIDVRMRKERILWANLGVRPTALFALYAVAAIPAESLLALALR